MFKKTIQNERGDMSFFTIFVILAIIMLMSFVLLFASVKINCMNIHNAAKMELNNVSARIYADTFREARTVPDRTHTEKINEERHTPYNGYRLSSFCWQLMAYLPCSPSLSTTSCMCLQGQGKAAFRMMWT